jgi:hypothetical protein
MLKLHRSPFYILFVVALLTTEFLYIEIGGGVARIYHFWAVAIVLLLATSVPRLFRSRVFLALVLFAMVNLLAALLSDTPSTALASLLSNYANLAIVIVVAILLLRGRLTIEQLARTLLVVTMVSVVWGVIQIAAFKGGVMLALSPEQEAQIQQGFGPGFRTEANTFGKYMVLPFLLFLPAFLNSRRDRTLRLAYAVMVVGMLMNFTRTALYGVVAALVFAFFWYVVTGQLNKVTLRFLGIGSVFLLGITLILSDALPISDYARYKIENLFNQEEVLEGSSSAYRLEAMQAVLDNTLGNAKRMTIGNGWGQTHYVIRRQEVQAGGGDIINVLGFSGLIGDASYLLYTFLALTAALRVAWRRVRTPQTLFAEGVMFAIVGMFVTGQISGYLIAPEYYLLLGICVYLSLLRKPRRAYMARSPC